MYYLLTVVTDQLERFKVPFTTHNFKFRILIFVMFVYSYKRLCIF
jgi:hypothetical protein